MSSLITYNGFDVVASNLRLTRQQGEIGRIGFRTRFLKIDRCEKIKVIQGIYASTLSTGIKIYVNYHQTLYWLTLVTVTRSRTVSGLYLCFVTCHGNRE